MSSLPLDDPRWSLLKTCYDSTASRLIGMLDEAYTGRWENDLTGRLINEVLHQGDTSEAMYALAPHLIDLARTSSPERALELIILAGFIHASSQQSKAIACPAFLSEGFQASAEAGADFLSAAFRIYSIDFTNLKNMFASLAGFLGHGRFGLLIDGFDWHEGRFYHQISSEPLDEP